MPALLKSQHSQMPEERAAHNVYVPVRKPNVQELEVPLWYTHRISWRYLIKGASKYADKNSFFTVSCRTLFEQILSYYFQRASLQDQNC